MRLPFILLVLIGLGTSPVWAEERPPLNLASRGASAVERQAHYRAILREFTDGAGEEEVWVLALRGACPDGTRRDTGLNAGGYVDSLIVIAPGDGPVEEFRAATHAGAQSSPDFPFGVAQVRPGRYLAEPVRDPQGTAWVLSTGNGSPALPAWLDRDGDGVLSGAEKELDEHYGTTTKTVYLCDGMDPKRPGRVGAQTVAPEDYPRFVATVGTRQSFNYLLLDANRPRKEQSRDLRGLATPLSPPEPFGYYERIAIAKGVERDFDLLVILLRGIAPNGARHDSADNVGPYNDTFLVLDRQDRSVSAFRGSAHAGQASTTRSPGYYAGVAQLCPGLYWARSNAIYHGYWSWHVVNHAGDFQGRVPAWRDKDKDGYISSAERASAQRHGVTATEILIHNGLDSVTGDSIGCLTMPPHVMVRFIDKVGEGSSFSLLLLDANADP